MADNISLIVNETIDNVVINPSITNEVVDINVNGTDTYVDISVTPNLTIVNINKTTGINVQDLQSVTDLGSTTTNSITANSFIKSGSTGLNVLLDNGDTKLTTSILGTTNLNYTPAPTIGTVTSSTGNSATIPLADSINAGLLSAAEKTKLSNTSGVNTGDQDLSALATTAYVNSQDNLKVDKIVGKGLSTNDYTTAEQTKLAGISEGAEVNVNADWNAVSGDSQILNKPTIPSISGLATVTYVDTQDALKVDKVAGSRLITSAESTILGNTSGTNTGNQNLQSVTNLGASTTTPITANSFVKSGGTSSQILAADGSVITQGNNITITGGVISSVGGTGGGGSSVSYYLNGGTSQGTFGGTTYYEFNKTAVIATGVDFSRGSNGLIASFITDIADPSLLLIPGGNWNLEFFFSSSSVGGSPSFYVELYKYDGATFTLIASNSVTPEGITGGTSIDAYFTALAVPETILTVNDRLAIRVFVNASSKTITLHTQDSHLCEVITTFTSGLTALNGLQAQVQNFAIGTTGSDFAINSSGSIHTFNLPSADATVRGVVTTGTQTFAGDKTFTGTTAGINKTMVGLNNVDNTSDTSKPISTATQTALNLKQPLATVLTNTTASYTIDEQSKLYKYPLTATNGKILQGNGTNYVEINTPTGTTNLNYTPSTTNGSVTSSTGTPATIPLANATNAGLLKPLKFTVLENTSGTNTGDQDLSSLSPLASPAFTGIPTAPTATIGTNTYQLATTAFVNASIPGSTIYNILIVPPTTSITTELTGTSGGVSYPQNGKNVMINNGVVAISVNATVLSTATDFIASYTKIGTADITFTFTGTGATLIAPNGAILNGDPGSTALLTKNGTTVYLLINNLL